VADATTHLVPQGKQKTTRTTTKINIKEQQLKKERRRRSLANIPRRVQLGKCGVRV